MATLKHISSKNANYGDAEKYLTFEHDEFTMKATLDENGRLIPREDYRIATINCGDEDFAIACMRANLKYGKNQKREDVKSHHYIISFDPRDGADNGLTVDKAQELGEKYCSELFRGHQAIVCTHPDGHNHSGNIHVHIVINSLRIEDVPILPHMDRPADRKAGCKHRCTDAAMNYFKAEVMEMCQREGLYQIDLLNGGKERITEREYWANKKGQRALDEENALLKAEGKPVKSTKFETDKARLRRTIKDTLYSATSFDDFSRMLLQSGITVKESRGRLSYLTPDRTKPITARKLGDDFDKSAVYEVIETNAAKAKQIIIEPKPIQKMVDREAKRAEGKGIGYDRWAAKHNLKQLSQSMLAYQSKYGFSSMDELDAAIDKAKSDVYESRQSIKSLESTIKDKKEFQFWLLSYIETKEVRTELKTLKSTKAKNEFREKHNSDFIRVDAATRYFKAHGITKLPSSKNLQKEIEGLIKEKNAEYNKYHESNDKVKELMTIRSNLEQVLGKEKNTPSKQKRHEQEL